MLDTVIFAFALWFGLQALIYLFATLDVAGWRASLCLFLYCLVSALWLLVRIGMLGHGSGL